MKKKILLAVGAFLIVGLVGGLTYWLLAVFHGNNDARPPLLMHEGVLYRISEDNVRVSSEDVEGQDYEWYTIQSVVKHSEAPQRDGEANSGHIGQSYAFDRAGSCIYLRVESGIRRWYVAYLPLKADSSAPVFDNLVEIS